MKSVPTDDPLNGLTTPLPLLITSVDEVAFFKCKVKFEATAEPPLSFITFFFIVKTADVAGAAQKVVTVRLLSAPPGLP